MEKINAVEKACPIPVMMAKKALSNNDNNGVVVNVDNSVAVTNLKKLASSLGFDFSYKELKSDLFEVVINKCNECAILSDEKINAIANEDENSAIKYTQNPLCVVISKDFMGDGSMELGKILIKGFIYSLKELDTLPKYLIFLNSGVLLTKSDANTVDDIKDLVSAGVEVYVCGTCANYFKMTEQVAVGTITDMYNITSKMAISRVINI